MNPAATTKELSSVVANDSDTGKLTTTLISGEEKKSRFSENCKATGCCGLATAFIGGIVIAILYAGRCGTVVLEGGTPGITFGVTGKWSNSSLGYQDSIRTVFSPSDTSQTRHSFTISAEANGIAQASPYSAAAFDNGDFRIYSAKTGHSTDDSPYSFNQKHDDEGNVVMCTKVAVLKGYSDGSHRLLEASSDALQSMLSNNIFGEQKPNTKHLRGPVVKVVEKEEPTAQQSLGV